MRWFKPWFEKKPVLVAQRAPWDGQIVDVDVYLAAAWAELNATQKHLARSGKLTHVEWEIDPDAGLISFSRQDGVVARAPVQIVGAWDPAKERFAWGWDANGISPRMRADAERTRWFGDKHCLREFTGPILPADEREAWRLASVAMKVNAAAGVYRAPTPRGSVFLTMGDVRVTET